MAKKANFAKTACLAGSFMISASAVLADFETSAEYLLVWVLSNDYIDSGMRYESAGDCYANAQNIGLEMREVNMNPPQFICMPLAKDYPLAITTKQRNNSRFPF